ncbi:MAG: DUF4412 domain-containing protein [Ignavibacterium sp.]|nr:MAG: DUF4412 domain-containing protein [Ignavibacterium sp.]
MYNPKSKTIALLSCFIIFSASILFGQDRFEGKVTFKTDDDGKEQLMTYLMKGNKFRIEESEGRDAAGGVMIYDSETQMMTILMNEQKMYMEMPINDSKYTAQVQVDSEKPEYFAKTVEEKVILGHSCDKFEFKDKDKKGIAWMTKDLGSFMFMSNPKDMKKSQPSWQDEIMGAGYFPMLVKEEDSSGELITIFEVTELLSMDLDDDLFLVPPDFNKFVMPNMPNIMDMKKTK